MKRWLITAALLLAFAGIGGFAAAALGIIPITASSGHFEITERMLVFAKERSVATHTLGQKPPPLGDAAHILKGAGHFEAGCRPCHGAPDLPRLPRVPQAMLPPPPDLSAKVRDYEPEELFYIVKHGIKFTGMPAWPTQQRDDEVGALVAFLVELPKLDRAAYRRLVHGEAAAAAGAAATGERSDGSGAPAGDRLTSGQVLSNLPASHPRASHRAASDAEPLGVLIGAERAPRAVIASCGRCHGVDGRGRGNSAFPALAGQRQQYLLEALEAYANDQRHSGIMQPSAAALPDEELAEVAEYYSRQPRRAVRDSGGPGDPAAIERGRQIASAGVPDRRVPACKGCHGPSPDQPELVAPILAGQYAEYLELMLRLFNEKRRGGGERAHVMDAVGTRLSHEQMHDAALYYASLAP
jgi:cytochrome c553